MYNKCNALESSLNHPVSPPPHLHPWPSHPPSSDLPWNWSLVPLQSLPAECLANICPSRSITTFLVTRTLHQSAPPIVYTLAASSFLHDIHKLEVSLQTPGMADIVLWKPVCNSGKEPPCNAGDTRDSGLIFGLESSPRGEHGNPLQYPCLENPRGQRSLVGYTPWSHKESDSIEATEHPLITHNTD